jgi:hypothetical protein
MSGRGALHDGNERQHSSQSLGKTSTVAVDLNHQLVAHARCHSDDGRMNVASAAFSSFAKMCKRDLCLSNPRNMETGITVLLKAEPILDTGRRKGP